MRPATTCTPSKIRQLILTSLHSDNFCRGQCVRVFPASLPTILATIFVLYTAVRSQAASPAYVARRISEASAARIAHAMAPDLGTKFTVLRDSENQFAWPLAPLSGRIFSTGRHMDIEFVRVKIQSPRLEWVRWSATNVPMLPGTVTPNRPRSMWERNRKYIAPIVVVIFIQTLLIIGLLWQRARKLRAEAILRESEERFRLVANTAPVLIWMAGVNKLCTYVNRPWLEFTGRSIDEELGTRWTDGIHHEDVSRCLDTYNQSFDRREPFRMEYRLRRHDGDYRWVLDIGIPRFNPDSSFAGYIGSAIDVTERKEAEAALSSVSRKLIEAQEQERVRIARELHDDINQRIALLSVTLEGITKQLPDSVMNVADSIQGLARDTMEIGNDIQVISHRLHSSHLEYVGLAGAARSFCRELARQQNVKIVFSESGMERTVPHDIALCLYRVLQEALHNAVKHSGVERFVVELRGCTDDLQLVVRDSGAGFDTKSATNGQGLGLTSMRERVNLVNGTISISSSVASGTEVRVRIPMNANVATSQVSMSA